MKNTCRDGSVFHATDDDMVSFAALVAAAELAEMPPAQMIADVSKLDMSELAKMMKRAGPPAALVAVPARPDDIEAAVAAEREACAKVVEDTDVEQFTACMVLHDDGRATLAKAAAAIRARD